MFNEQRIYPVCQLHLWLRWVTADSLCSQAKPSHLHAHPPHNKHTQCTHMHGSSLPDDAMFCVYEHSYGLLDVTET